MTFSESAIRPPRATGWPFLCHLMALGSTRKMSRISKSDRREYDHVIKNRKNLARRTIGELGRRQGTRARARVSITARHTLKAFAVTNWPMEIPRCFVWKSICAASPTLGIFWAFPYPIPSNNSAKLRYEVIRANKLKACYIRPLAFLGLGELGIYVTQ